MKIYFFETTEALMGWTLFRLAIVGRWMVRPLQIVRTWAWHGADRHRRRRHYGKFPIKVS